MTEGGRCGANPFFRFLLVGQVREVGVRLVVSHGREIGEGLFFPAGVVALAHSAAALGEACVAECSFEGQNLSSRGLHRLRHLREDSLSDALVALAVVIGAHIKEHVVIAVVPFHNGVLVAHETERVRVARCVVASDDLVIDPASGNHGVCSQQLRRGGGFHF